MFESHFFLKPQDSCESKHNFKIVIQCRRKVVPLTGNTGVELTPYGDSA